MEPRFKKEMEGKEKSGAEAIAILFEGIPGFNESGCTGSSCDACNECC